MEASGLKKFDLLVTSCELLGLGGQKHSLASCLLGAVVGDGATLLLQCCEVSSLLCHGGLRVGKGNGLLSDGALCV